jgi:hypothetical protein
MTGKLKTLDRTTFPGLNESVCSAELQDGNWPSTSPVGEKNTAGPAPAPARPSRSQERKNDALRVADALCRALDELATSYASDAATLGLPMPATYGRNSGDSSPGAGLQSSWASRLRDRMARYGSPEFELVWKSSDMALGPAICLLRASPRRTDGTGSTGSPQLTVCPTPRSSPSENRNTRSAPSHGETHGLTLAGVAHDLTGWPTPNSEDGGSEQTHRGVGTRLKLLGAARTVTGWPTASARDWRSGKASPGTMERNSRPLSEQIGGQLNPTWVEWLMGFPLGWTDCELLEMP